MKMGRILFLLVLLTLCSCSGEKKEYYNSGNLKKVYTKEKGKYNGTYFEYYENGKLKEKHTYFDGIRIDTSFYHHPSSHYTEIKVWNKDQDRHKSILLDSQEEIVQEGMLSNTDSLRRIGIWRFNEANGREWDSLVQYKDAYGKSYANQIWLVDKNEDTLTSRGNHFFTYVDDTTRLGNVTRLGFELTKAYFRDDSEMFVIIPYDDGDLNEDYSNLLEVERDTFLSLQNDGISNTEIPSLVRLNHNVEFGLEYEKPGRKRVRGVIVEKIKEKGEDLERRLFFEEEFYVKDTVPLGTGNE